LFSTEYVSAKAKLKVRCADGHEFEITPDNLKHRKWCKECKRQKHYKRMATNLRTVQELRDFARQSHGGDCLATASAPMLSKVYWNCAKAEHPPFPAVIAKVFRGQWCGLCWQERRKPPKPAISFDRVIDYVRERGGEIISIGNDGIWKGSKTRLVIRCPNGHQWPADASNLLYAGSWCPECLVKGEQIVRAIFEETFGGKFPKSKPEWLVSSRGRKLELDGYNQQQKLAFEYQGPHHYLDDYVKVHDAVKRKNCAAKNIRLIEVEAIKKPYPPENVLKKVAEAFQKYGITDKPCLPSTEIFESELNQLRKLARRNGGQLISDRYLGGSERHEWKCDVAEHPSWWAEPWRIRKGKWCASCAGNRRLGIEGLQLWGNTVGLDLTEAEYKGGNNTSYRWRCHKSGHVIERSRSNILQSLERGREACSVCSRTAR
jgi:hypothetical protein